MFPLLFVLIQYIFLWIVLANFFEYFESTFAALPVGAIRIARLFNKGKDFTRAEISVVFPVPAYPLSINILLLPIVDTNSDI